MIDQVSLLIRKTRVNEGDTFNVDAAFVDNGTEALDTPTSVDFRVDCLTTGQVVKDWTAAALGDSSTVQMDSAFSVIINRWNRTERKQVTVRLNRDDDSQVSARACWTVRNQDFLP